MDLDAELNPGDIVRSEEDGPNMMVDRIVAAGERVLCIWFEDGVRRRRPFNKIDLTLATVT